MKWSPFAVAILLSCRLFSISPDHLIAPKLFTFIERFICTLYGVFKV
jgi:hypothetical protein